MSKYNDQTQRCKKGITLLLDDKSMRGIIVAVLAIFIQVLNPAELSAHLLKNVGTVHEAATQRSSPFKYEVLGVLLDKGKIILSEATGITAVLIRKTDESGASSDRLVLKVFDSRKIIT